MTAYAINPPGTPFGSAGGAPVIISPEWYRYLVRNKAQGDGLTDAPVITFGDASTIFPNSRSLVAEPGELTETDGGSEVRLGLADTIPAGTVGDASHLVVLAFDAKGRLTAASQVALESGNVTETTKLFFTTARARASIGGSAGISYDSSTGSITLDQSFARGLVSGGSGISYNSGSGVIATSGFSGTLTPPLSLTFVNGICTAGS